MYMYALVVYFVISADHYFSSSLQLTYQYIKSIVTMYILQDI